MEWEGIFDNMIEHTDPEGLPYLKIWRSKMAPIDEALKVQDLAGVAEIARVTLPDVKKLVPHVRNEELRKFVLHVIDEVEKLIVVLESYDADMSALNTFVESATANARGIFAKITDTVVYLVGDVLDSILLK